MRYDHRDLNILALTILGEAAMEPREGKIAVAWTVRNRVEADLHRDGRPDWWGEGYANVCLKAYQYSCWIMEPTGQGGKLRAYLVGGDTGRGELKAGALKDPLLPCWYAAQEVLTGRAPDPTHGSTHYYADYIDEPKWARGKTPVAVFGVHRFYNDVEPGYEAPRPPEAIGDPPEPVLRPNDSGLTVRRFQAALNQAWPRIEADGEFGPATEAAVKLFQSAHGLEADGIVGARTWGALRQSNPQGE